jgi:hypothetical protein
MKTDRTVNGIPFSSMLVRSCSSSMSWVLEKSVSLGTKMCFAKAAHVEVGNLPLGIGNDRELKIRVGKLVDAIDRM